MATSALFRGPYEPDRSGFNSEYRPKPQPFYSYTDGAWRQVTETSTADETVKITSTLRLLTWNIDILSNGGEIRMRAALKYLEKEIALDSTSEPVVILLQEMSVSDLQLIQAAKWIQDRFYVTDVSNTNWADRRYGTTTLMDKKLVIENVFRVYYRSDFGRDGLFVDIAVTPASKVEGSSKTLRIGNTHLESLVADPPLRPAQVAGSARHMHAPEVYAAVLAGDFNAIQDFDRSLHTENNLQDAYLTLGGVEDSEEGHTWGYQCEEETMKRFGPSRMDKLMFCGDVKINDLKRLGVGAKVEEEKRAELSALTNGLEWITDHYGLAATLTILPCQGEAAKI